MHNVLIVRGVVFGCEDPSLEGSDQIQEGQWARQPCALGTNACGLLRKLVSEDACERLNVKSV